MLLFAFMLSSDSSAQVVLQLERYGSAKTRKFNEGYTLTYRISNDKTWYQSEIAQLIPGDNIVVLEKQYLRLEDFRSIRSDHPQRWSKPIAYNLYIFGTSWSLFTLGAAVASKDANYTLSDASVTATSLATGFLIQKAFKYRTWHMGKKHRLRILDLRAFPGF